MNTQFEINIKKVSVKIDEQFVCLFINDSLVLKTALEDIRTIAVKAKQQVIKLLSKDEDA